MVHFLFLTEDVEMDIAQLHQDVPQLSRVFTVIDKIGEGESALCVIQSLYLYTFVHSKNDYFFK